MAERKGVYFVSDVHLGLELGDPQDRERRFVSFLAGIPRDTTRALYMLGDVWDFWYEYKYVVPKGYVRVFAELLSLMDGGVEVYFLPGNHDMWCFSYFEELGIKVLSQPCLVELDSKVFCLGHGDGLGPVPRGYTFMHALFASKVVQFMFGSLLHPTVAFTLGRHWSGSKRKSRPPYRFRGADEPLYKFAEEYASSTHVDYFIFGHYHSAVDETLPCGARLLMTESWIDGSPYWYWDGISVLGGHSKNSE